MSDGERLKRYLVRFNEGQISKPTLCEVCQSAGHLRWHGHYWRALITMADAGAIPIKRVLCVLCHHTFSLLPAFIAKWHRYSKTVIQTAVKWLKSKTFDFVADQLTQHCGCFVATLTLYFWRKKFS